MKCPYCPASYSTATEVNRHLQRSLCHERWSMMWRIFDVQWRDAILLFVSVQVLAGRSVAAVQWLGPDIHDAILALPSAHDIVHGDA